MYTFIIMQNSLINIKKQFKIFIFKTFTLTEQGTSYKCIRQLFQKLDITVLLIGYIRKGVDSAFRC